MDQVWNAIVTDVLPVVSVFAKGVAAALIVGALAQLTVQYLLRPVAVSEKTPDFLTPLASGIPNRMATLFIAQAAVVAAHGLDIWTYGDGPKGYGCALLFGFLGGGLMPWVHDQIVARTGKAGSGSV